MELLPLNLTTDISATNGTVVALETQVHRVEPSSLASTGERVKIEKQNHEQVIFINVFVRHAHAPEACYNASIEFNLYLFYAAPWHPFRPVRPSESFIKQFELKFVFGRELPDLGFRAYMCVHLQSGKRRN